MDVLAEVETKDKDKDNNTKLEKSKKKPHKSCKDRSDQDSKQRKDIVHHHQSNLIIPPVIRTVCLPLFPVLKTLLNLRSLLSQGHQYKAAEPGSQTFAKRSTSQDSSIAAHTSAPSSQDLSSYYPTGTEVFRQSQETFSETYPLSFTGPPEADDVPLSEPHESDPEYSGSVSESDENTECVDKHEQTENLTIEKL